MDRIASEKSSSRGGLIGAIVMLNVVMMISTDMYLPALPHMGEAFAVGAGVVNLTLVGFFAFFALGVLAFGPLSDSLGRRPFLVGGCALYVASSCACALAPSIWVLVLGRVAQAIGSGCLLAVSTAMIKDRFEGRDREFVLSLTQSISLIGPMVAPFLGSLMLMLASWRGIFWLLAAFGSACLAVVLLVGETLPPEARSGVGLAGSLGRLVAVGRNRSFLAFLLVVALLTMPYAAYLAACSYVYIGRFGLSNGLYSLFFAANASLSIAAPFVYLRMSDRLRPRLIMAICLALAFSSGCLLLSCGSLAPLAFFLSFAPFVLAEGVARPFGMILLLDQQEGDAGSAASLINFVLSIASSAGMALGGMGWSSYVSGLGIVTLACALAAAAGWAILLGSKARLRGL